MPELRKDPIIGRWVIISTERGKRPSDFASESKAKDNKLCPFCYGNEHLTPPEVYAIRSDGSRPNTPGWKLRVIPNKYPALKIEGDLNREGEGIFDRMNGVGAHEVIIESPDHMKDLADLESKHIEDVLKAFINRMKDLRKDVRFRYCLVFKNHGKEAGASLEHTHSQMIATPIVPKSVMEEMEGGRKYYEYKERCIFCDIIRQEISQNIRLIGQNENVVAIEPFAPRFPFETWVLPRNHIHRFEDTDEETLISFASMLKSVLARLRTALNDPPFNFIVHTGPWIDGRKNHYHWHMEIFPKLTRVAGFEWGTGFYINPTPPEEAARYLNEINP
ncbi:MAG: galactose-1-phosphate uridylyltransferase [candidate division Zixibacteria bacterium]|nr:galactose-1-phosphate uridylyltransferase [candidate division Zixibacteria bacterium]